MIRETTAELTRPVNTVAFLDRPDVPCPSCSDPWSRAEPAGRFDSGVASFLDGESTEAWSGTPRPGVHERSAATPSGPPPSRPASPLGTAPAQPEGVWLPGWGDPEHVFDGQVIDEVWVDALVQRGAPGMRRLFWGLFAEDDGDGVVRNRLWILYGQQWHTLPGGDTWYAGLAGPVWLVRLDATAAWPGFGGYRVLSSAEGLRSMLIEPQSEQVGEPPGLDAFEGLDAYTTAAAGMAGAEGGPSAPPEPPPLPAGIQLSIAWDLTFHLAPGVLPGAALAPTVPGTVARMRFEANKWFNLSSETWNATCPVGAQFAAWVEGGMDEGSFEFTVEGGITTTVLWGSGSFALPNLYVCDVLPFVVDQYWRSAAGSMVARPDLFLPGPLGGASLTAWAQSAALNVLAVFDQDQSGAFCADC